MSMPEAIEGGADAFFDEKYGETVRTIRVEGYSFELCGGTHCRATGQIGGFVITGERSIGSGMRRIEAVTGAAADALVRERFDALERAADAARRAVGRRDRRARSPRSRTSCARRNGASRPAPGPVCPSPASWPRPRRRWRPASAWRRAALAFESMDALKAAARDLRGALGSGVIALGLDADEPQLFVTVTDDLVARGHLGGRPRDGRDAGDRRPRRRPTRDGPGPGHPPRRACPTRSPRSGPASRTGPDGLLAPHLAARRQRARWPPARRSTSGPSSPRRSSSTSTPNGHGTVRGVGRKRQGLSHMQSGTVADIAAVVDNCAVALQEAEEMAGFRPTQVVIGIAGELVKGFTTTHSQERKKPDQPITEAELQKLIDGVQREALHEAERAITWETGLPHVDVRLVHAAVTGASIDGYALTNPVGFQGRHVKIGIFNAFAPLVHLGALQSVACAARPRAARDRRRAVRGRARPRQRPDPPGRGAVRRRRRRHDRRGARPPGRHRGDAHVRARRPGVHQEPRRPARPALPAGRGAQGRLRPRRRRSSTRRTSPRSSPTTSGSGPPASSW